MFKKRKHSVFRLVPHEFSRKFHINEEFAKVTKDHSFCMIGDGLKRGNTKRNIFLISSCKQTVIERGTEICGTAIDKGVGSIINSFWMKNVFGEIFLAIP